MIGKKDIVDVEMYTMKFYITCSAAMQPRVRREIFREIKNIGCVSSLMVSVLDVGARDHGFDFRHIHMTFERFGQLSFKRVCNTTYYKMPLAQTATKNICGERNRRIVT